MCVLTRDAAIEVLAAVTCAPITRTKRGIPSEVEVGRTEGLAERSVVNCDNVVTIPKVWIDPSPVGRLKPAQRLELDAALRYALDIQF